MICWRQSNDYGKILSEKIEAVCKTGGEHIYKQADIFAIDLITFLNIQNILRTKNKINKQLEILAFEKGWCSSQIKYFLL